MAGIARYGRLRVGDELVVLDIESLDFRQCAGSSNELSNNGELLARVDSHALTIEGLVALPVGVEVASIGVTVSTIPSRRVGTTTAVTIAHGLTCGFAGVRSIGGGHGVSLPDVHLGAA